MRAMDALECCRRAWEQSQPQLPLELYPDAIAEDSALGLALLEPNGDAETDVAGSFGHLAVSVRVGQTERVGVLDGGVDPEGAVACRRVSSPHDTSVERVHPVATHSSQCRTPPSSGQADGSALVFELEGEDAVRPEAARVLPTGGYKA